MLASLIPEDIAKDIIKTISIVWPNDPEITLTVTNPEKLRNEIKDLVRIKDRHHREQEISSLLLDRERWVLAPDIEFAKYKPHAEVGHEVDALSPRLHPLKDAICQRIKQKAKEARDKKVATLDEKITEKGSSYLTEFQEPSVCVKEHTTAMEISHAPVARYQHSY